MTPSALIDAARRPAVRFTFGVHTIVAVALCFVPLFDTLGFERAFVSGLCTAVTSPVVANSLLRRARERGGDDVGRIFFHALLLNLGMLLPTIAGGALVEWIGQPCDTEAGLSFVALVAAGNAIFGTALGVTGGALAFRRGLPGIAITLCLVAFLYAALARLYADPQIFVYSSPFGFWPGSIYDEELRVDARLVGFRVYSTLLALTLVTLTRAFTERATLLLDFRRPAATTIIGALALAALTFRAAAAGEDLGFDLDRASIESKLSRVEETDHFVIHIDPSVPAKQAARIRNEHEFRYAQLSEFFGGGPDGKIKSFVYRDTAQKAALMGAGRTQVARPWALEIHIDGFTFPHRVLKHELAHVFASRIATGPFKVPATSWVFVNIGIVEGIAVAADWRVSELTVHGWARAMRELDLLPNLRRALDVAGFWSMSSSRAYTAAGSFVRYLVDEYGMEKFGAYYAGNDIEAAYGRSLDELVTEWETFVSNLPLSEENLLIAEHRFRRPSIFQKVCAHKTANLAARGYKRLGGGDIEGGIQDLERLLDYAPQSTRPLIAISAALARNGKLDEAATYATRALETEGATQKSGALAREALGNIAWRRGDTETAKRAFEEVRRLHLSTPSDRLQSARLYALTRPLGSGEILRDYLIGDLDPIAAVVRLGALTATTAQEGVPSYLYARALENAGVYPEGVQAAADAVAWGLPGEALTVEARLTHGRILFLDGRHAEASAVFGGVHQDATNAAIRRTALDWRERARFAATGRLE